MSAATIRGGELGLGLERPEIGEQQLGRDLLVREPDPLTAVLVDQQRVGAVLEVQPARVARMAPVVAVADRRILVERRLRGGPVLERLLPLRLVVRLAVLLVVLGLR